MWWLMSSDGTQACKSRGAPAAFFFWLMSVSVRKAKKDQNEEQWKKWNIQSGLESAGPDVYESIFVDAMKSESFSGAPGFPTSLTSARETPLVSPSPAVEAMTPSYRCPVFVTRVMVVPCMRTNMNESRRHNKEINGRSIQTRLVERGHEGQHWSLWIGRAVES